MIAARSYWYKNHSQGLRALCQVSGTERIIAREQLAHLDRYARGLSVAEQHMQSLADAGLLLPDPDQQSKLPRIGIVTTVRNPVAEFDQFLRFHIQHYGCLCYVFMDDPDEALTLPMDLQPSVQIIREQERDDGISIYREFAPLFKREPMARQTWNMDRALRLAAEDNLDWLFHIDADELLLLPDGLNTLATVPDQIGSVVIVNDEAAVTKNSYGSYFLESHVFKTNPILLPLAAAEAALNMLAGQWFFTAYTNGKSGVRIGPGARPIGPHRFHGPTGRDRHVQLPGARVLHYVNCGFAHFLRKYRLRRNMTDRYMNGAERIPFHLAARDAYLQSGEAGLKAFYAQHVQLTQEEAENLQEHGYAERWQVGALVAAYCKRQPQQASDRSLLPEFSLEDA